MQKDLKTGLLLDFYADFLTEKQRSVMEMYYAEDYSLSEIAELAGVTRQGVLDMLRRGEAKLAEMEQKLRMMRRHEAVSAALARCIGLAARLKDQGCAEAEELTQALRGAQKAWEDKDGV